MRTRFLTGRLIFLLKACLRSNVSSGLLLQLYINNFHASWNLQFEVDQRYWKNTLKIGCLRDVINCRVSALGRSSDEDESLSFLNVYLISYRSFCRLACFCFVSGLA
jgi:hypothetical protein